MLMQAARLTIVQTAVNSPAPSPPHPAMSQIPWNAEGWRAKKRIDYWFLFLRMSKPLDVRASAQ